MSTPVLPDSKAVVREALLAQPSVATLVGSRIVGRMPPEGSAVFPLLVVSIVDDAELQFHTGFSRVQVDVWGNGSQETDEQTVRLIARTIVSVVRDLRGAYASGRISNSGVALMTSEPDPTNGRARIVVDLEVEIDPL